MAIQITGGITIRNGGVAFGPGASFTLPGDISTAFESYSGDGFNVFTFTTPNYFTVINGVQTTTYRSYVILKGPAAGFIGRLNNAFTAAGMTTNDNGGYAYLWNVTWGDNSTGVVRMQWSSDLILGTTNNGVLRLSPVDTTINTDWQTPDTSFTNPYPVYPSNAIKTGTFRFPATFTPYSPLTEKGLNGQWC